VPASIGIPAHCNSMTWITVIHGHHYRVARYSNARRAELDVKNRSLELHIGRDKDITESDPDSVENPLQSTDDRGQTMVPRNSPR